MLSGESDVRSGKPARVAFHARKSTNRNSTEFDHRSTTELALSACWCAGRHSDFDARLSAASHGAVSPWPAFVPRNIDTMTNRQNTKQPRFAVLIDADNAPVAIIAALLEEVAKYGIASIRRAYGDWTTPHLAGWKETLNRHAIQPIQQFRYIAGKNATDAALIIDAMDLLYRDQLDGFCLVSSDSDFTRLATRLRESRMTVIGFGEKKTPHPFVAACDRFVHVESLNPRTRETPPKAPAAKAPAAALKPTRRTTKELRADTKLVHLLRTAAISADVDGWVFLGQFGNNLAKQSPGFNHRSYGYAQLGSLVVATGLFEIQDRKNGSGHVQKFLRDKRASRTVELRRSLQQNGSESCED